MPVRENISHYVFRGVGYKIRICLEKIDHLKEVISRHFRIVTKKPNSDFRTIIGAIIVWSRSVFFAFWPPINPILQGIFKILSEMEIVFLLFFVGGTAGGDNAKLLAFGNFELSLEKSSDSLPEGKVMFDLRHFCCILPGPPLKVVLMI